MAPPPLALSRCSSGERQPQSCARLLVGVDARSAGRAAAGWLGGGAAPPPPPPDARHPTLCREEVDALIAEGKHIYLFKGGVYDVNVDEIMHPGGRQVRPAVAAAAVAGRVRATPAPRRSRTSSC